MTREERREVEVIAPDSAIELLLASYARLLGATDIVLVHLDVGLPFDRGDGRCGMNIMLDRVDTGKPIIGLVDPKKWDRLDRVLLQICLYCENVRLLRYDHDLKAIWQAYESLCATMSEVSTPTYELRALASSAM